MEAARGLDQDRHDWAAVTSLCQAIETNRAEREIEDALVLMKPVASAARMGCMTGSRHS
ncbi:hypothetical protein VPARA_04880 [Variovorax paradoxus]|jgi:hypothetical protein|uniref:Uncharacterized protein n=1 Tax=Variovorax paradoxus TaxID=34073 RepID=A0A0H2M7R5_VARPD|nr:hypothetical protein VPARA_04880 [Variovorax paradoxus]